MYLERVLRERETDSYCIHTLIQTLSLSLSPLTTLSPFSLSVSLDTPNTISFLTRTLSLDTPDTISSLVSIDRPLQPTADRVAQHLEIILKNFQFSTRRTRILMRFIIYYLVLLVNPMGRILVRWTNFRNNLEILCHPICNWL